MIERLDVLQLVGLWIALGWIKRFDFSYPAERFEFHRQSGVLCSRSTYLKQEKT
jgi:hypothetical protein